MQTKRIGADRADGENQASDREDAKARARVLGLILAEHPAQRSEVEVVRVLAGPEPGFASADVVRRAISDLVDAGLLHEQGGGVVVPTMAALVFSALDLA